MRNGIRWFSNSIANEGPISYDSADRYSAPLTLNQVLEIQENNNELCLIGELSDQYYKVRIESSKLDEKGTPCLKIVPVHNDHYGIQFVADACKRSYIAFTSYQVPTGECEMYLQIQDSEGYISEIEVE